MGDHLNHYDDGKKTPRKSDLIPPHAKKNNNNSRFCLLSRKAVLLQSKKEIENWSSLNKAEYNKKESIGTKADHCRVSQMTNCQTQV